MFRMKFAHITSVRSLKPTKKDLTLVSTEADETSSLLCSNMTTKLPQSGD